MKVFLFILFLINFDNMNLNLDNKLGRHDLIGTITQISKSGLIVADPYEMMQSVFVGNPSISEIKPLIEGILKKYNLPANDEYRLKVGSMVLGLRKENNGNVTEMQLLRHIYYYGSDKISLPDQAGLSIVILLKGI